MAKKITKKAAATKKNTIVAKKSSTKKVANARVDRVKSVKKATQKSSKSTVEKSSGFKGIPMIAMAIFGSLFLLSVVMLFRQSKQTTDAVIVHDVQRLKEIMEEIHKDCKIIDLEHTKNYVDFLTVKEFVGSEVGAVNLSYPQNWKGPYVKDNPTVQQQQYIILKNNNGYYIVPGDGVVLGNGKKVGKDIILDETTDVEKLLQDPDALKSPQGALGDSLNIGSSMFSKVLHAPLRYL